MATVRLAPSELRALSRKYRVLAELRRRQREAMADREAELQSLSREFPGVLRELERLPLDEIDRRSEAIERALAGGGGERWMAWMIAYHSEMRAALFVRRELRGKRALSDSTLRDVAARARRELGVRFDFGFVRQVMSPPPGRLAALVLRRLELTFGDKADGIATTLFLERTSA